MSQKYEKIKRIIKEINHGCVKLQGNNQTIYVDPFDIQTTYSDADLIFITHPHVDHFDIQSIKKLIKNTTKFVIPTYVDGVNSKNKDMEKELMAAMKQLEKSQIISVSPNKEYTVNGVFFKTVPSYNKNHIKECQWVGYTIELEGYRFHITGDTGYTKELLEVITDVILFPIDGVFNMTVAEAVKVINDMKHKPKIVHPYHYGNPIFDEIAGINTKGQGILFQKEMAQLKNTQGIEVVL